MVRFKHRYLLCSVLWSDPHALQDLFLGGGSSRLSLDSRDDRSTTTTTTTTTGTTWTPPVVTEAQIIKLLRQSLEANFGDLGAGEVGGTFSVKYWSPTSRTMILRVSREHYRTLWASLTLLRRLGGQPVIVRVTHVSGTIRKVQHAAIKQDRDHVLTSYRVVLERQRRRPPREGEGEGEVEDKLKQSEETIMALEA